MEKEFDIIGIGNPLLDFTVKIGDQGLAEIDLVKGACNYVPAERSKEIFENLKKYQVKTSMGGSTANTLAGAGNLGAKTVCMGRIGNDEHGDIYLEGLNISRIESKLTRMEAQTGSAITFITPDNDRTFATHLGAALYFTKKDLFEEEIAKSKVLYIEGYQLEMLEQRVTAIRAMEVAKENNTLVAIDLADYTLIERAGPAISLIIQKHADIVFANELEAELLTGKKDIESAKKLAENISIAVVKLGDKGSIIASNGDIIKIPVVEAEVVNTNGAGDMYAGAFLWALTNNLSLEKAGRIASYCAAQVVASEFSRLERDLKDEIKNLM